MADITVTSGILAYVKKARTALQHGCKTAIFNDSDKVYSVKGKKSMVREITANKAGTYIPSKGYSSGGGGGTVKWEEYYANLDRFGQFTIDALDEMASFVEGDRPSIMIAGEEFLEKQLPAEIDANNIARWYNAVPAGNKFASTAAGYGVDAAGILATILNLRSKVFASGAQDAVLFVRSSVYTNLMTALISNHAFAGGGLKDATLKVNSKIYGDTEDGVDVEIAVKKFDMFYLVEMPDDRMYSNIIFFDGASEGQTDGGYGPDIADGCVYVDLLAIPFGAAFTNMKYIVDNYLVPGGLELDAEQLVELREMNGKMYGNVEINHAGINQKANGFELDIRAVFGGDIFKVMKNNCYAVYSSMAGAVTAAFNKTTLSVVAEADAEITVTTVPYGAQLFCKSSAEAKATVDWKDDVPGTLVITGVAAGSSNITVHAKSDCSDSALATCAVTVTGS